MKDRLLIAAVLCLVPPAAQTLTSENCCAIRGQVVDGLSGRPVNDVELALHTGNWDSAAEPIAPDAQGRFVFNGLAAGQYLLSAARPDLGTVFFGELPEPGTFQTIRVGPEDDERLVVFRLVPRGVVTGVIRDEFGDPVAQATVSVSRPVWREGQIVLAPFNQVATDDRGRYRIGKLSPGGYVICAAANHSGNPTPAPMLGPVDFASHTQARFYARSCYPRTSGPLSSTLRIMPGQRIDMDLTLESVPAVWVRGRIRNRLPEAPAHLRLIREDAFESTWQQHGATYNSAEGTFAFRGVLPGRYVLEAEVTGKDADGVQKSLMARAPIEVGGVDLNGIELPLEPASEIDVVIHGPDNEKTDLGAVSIGLRSSAPGRAGTRWAQRGSGGAVRLGPLHPGDYWLLTRTAKESICVQSVRLGEQDVLQRTLTVTPGLAAQLDVTTSKRCGVIKGRVLWHDRPVPDSKVLLLLSGSAKNPGDLVTDFTDDRGEFSFAGLPAGRYQLWAWSVDDFGSFVGPARLADEEQRATTVVVRQGEQVEVDVVLLKAEGEAN